VILFPYVSQVAEMLLKTGTGGAVRLHDDGSSRRQHRVGVANSPAGWLSASAHVSCAEAAGLLAARSEHRSAASCDDVPVSNDVTPFSYVAHTITPLQRNGNYSFRRTDSDYPL
jgi:hypothetical protein